MSKAPTTPTDDDLDALLAVGPRPGAKECATGWALQRLDPDTAAKFRQLMDNNVPGRDIAAAFERRGFPWATPQSVTRHAAGSCRNCPDRAA